MLCCGLRTAFHKGSDNCGMVSSQLVHMQQIVPVPQVPKAALQMAFCGGKLQTIAKRVVQLSLDGLQRRGLGEEQYLEPLLEIAESGVTRAERMLALYHGAWKGSLDPLYAGDFDFRDGDTARFTCN